MPEATDGGLKAFGGLRVKSICLRYEVCGSPLAPLGSVELVGWPGLPAPDFWNIQDAFFGSWFWLLC